MTRSMPTPPAAAPETSGLGEVDHGQARILTGEAVHLEVRIAGVGSRALARFVDLIVQVVLSYALSILVVVIVGMLSLLGVLSVDDAIGGILYLVVLVAAFIGYPVFFETITKGRTAGKAMLGLRVVRDDGGPITFRQALTRSLISFAIEVPGILGPINWLATIWIMIGSKQSKRIGDHVAGTIVIHERTPTAWGWVPAMPAGLGPWAATLDLGGIDDDLAAAVRSFLARNRRIREPARSELGERLVREVRAVTNPPPPPGTPEWMYLAAVHAERHRRAMARLAAVRARAATVWPELASTVPFGQSTVHVPAQPNNGWPQ